MLSDLALTETYNSGYSKTLPMATDTDSRPGAMLMAGEGKGYFLKAKEDVTLSSARKSFLFSYMLLINSSEQRQVHVEQISYLCENIAIPLLAGYVEL